MKNITLTLLLICLFSFAYSQRSFNGKVSGRIVETQLTEPLQYATIAVYNATDSILANGSISDSTGLFNIEMLKPGEYYLVIDALGFKQKIVGNIKLNNENPHFHKDNIGVEIDPLALDEVLIISERRMIELRPDRKVIHVDESIASSGGTAADVLQLLPEVNVSQGSITLNNHSFTVLINGKPSGITAVELLQYPASLIESIEVITNPSVKYRPEGLGGIINLKLKERRQGLNFVSQASAGSDQGYHVSTTINYAVNKINLFANFHGNHWGGETDGFLNTTVHNQYQLNEVFNMDNKFFRYNIKAGFDYDPDSLNQFTFFWSQSNDIGSFSKLSKTEMLYDDNSLVYNTDIKSIPKSQQNDFSLNYKRLFNREDTELSFDIFHSREFYLDSDKFFITKTQPEFERSRYSLSPEEKEISTELNLDFVLPVNSTFEFETGVNAFILDALYENSGETYNFDTETWNDSTAIRNTFDFDRNIFGAYTLLSIFLENFDFQVGLRGEYTDVSTHIFDTGQKNPNNYFDLFSSAGIAYYMSDETNLNFNYSKRIERPYAFQLSPFEYPGDHYSEKYSGNPDLEPAYTNSFQLGFVHYMDKLTLNGSISYLNSENVIHRFFHMDDNSSVKIKTWASVAEEKNYMFSSSVTWNASQRFRTNLSGRFYKKEWQTILDGTNSSDNYFGYNLRSISRVDFERNYAANLILVYQPATYFLNNMREQEFYISITARKNISDNFIVSARLNDLLNNKTRFSDWSNDHHSDSQLNYNNRAIYIGVMYKFGSDIKTRADTDLNTREIRLQRD